MRSSLPPSSSDASNVSACAGVVAQLAKLTKRYFFASARSRYTASFCLNSPSSVGSSCACCHSHSASPSYAVGIAVVVADSSSTDARRSSSSARSASRFARILIQRATVSQNQASMCPF